MKRIVIAIILILMISYNIMAAGTEFTLNAKIIRTETDENIIQRMNVWGNAPESFIGKKVAITILKPDYASNEDLSNEEKFAGFYQGYIKEDSSFEFDFPFYEETGEYTIELMADTFASPISTKIFVSSIEALLNLIDSLKNKTISKYELKDVINENSETIGIDITVFEKLSDNMQTDICDIIIKESDTYTIDEFIDLFYNNVIILGLSKNQDLSLKKQILELYEDDYIKLKEENLYAKYSALSVSEQEKVLSNISDNAKDIEEIKKSLFEQVFLVEFGSIQTYTQIKNILMDFKDYLLLNNEYDKVRSLKEQDEKAVYLYVEQMKNKIKTLVDFKNTINFAIENLDKIKNNEKPTEQRESAPRNLSISPKADNSETLEPKNEYTTHFIDLKGYSWAEEAINYLFNKKILHGKEINKFYPKDLITRKEFAKIISEAFSYTDENAVCYFEDIRKDDWSYIYVASVFQKSIVMGISKNLFGGDEFISREDIATIIYRIYMSSVKSFAVDNLENNFDDFDEISDYAINSVLYLQKMNIIKGFSDNTFRPKEKATRAEVAVIIHNVLNGI